MLQILLTGWEVLGIRELKVPGRKVNSKPGVTVHYDLVANCLHLYSTSIKILSHAFSIYVFLFIKVLYILLLIVNISKCNLYLRKSSFSMTFVINPHKNSFLNDFNFLSDFLR